jgi:disulfide bond formation protein DsbB
MSKRLLVISSLMILFAFLVAACGGGGPAPTPTPSGDAVAGKEAYLKTCIACHGPDGKGMPNLGKDLTTSEFVKSKTDLEMVEFLKVGRPASDPLNTQGIDMPPKGGNPALTETDLKNIVAFMRTINQ